jgi:hypothetical protein
MLIMNVTFPTGKGDAQYGFDDKSGGDPIQFLKELWELSKWSWDEVVHPGSNKAVRNASDEHLRTIYLLNNFNEISAKLDYKYAHPPSRVEDLDAYGKKIGDLLSQQS